MKMHAFVLAAAIGAAGCSSIATNAVATPPNDASAGAPETEDAGGARASADAGAVHGSCPAASEIDVSEAPYKPANVVAGACTSRELSAMVDYMNKTLQRVGGVPHVSEMSALVSTKCASCAFSDGSGPKWTPMLTKGDEIDVIDRGACIEVVSGNFACGKAYQHVAQCVIDACAGCSADARTECLSTSKAVKQACSVSSRVMLDTCGPDLQKYEDTCLNASYDFEGVVRALCVGP